VKILNGLMMLSGVMAAGFGWAQEPGLTGKWMGAATLYGTPVAVNFEFKQEGEKLSGSFLGYKLEGTVRGSVVEFHGKQGEDTAEVKATLRDGTMSGTAHEVDGGDAAHPMDFVFTATRVAARPTGAPVRHEFVPTVYYRTFSSLNKPVLTIAPGDTVHTTTVDAGGTDYTGVRRSLGGNPETGPFFVETAMPGDTLVVHLVRLKLNRDYAISDDGIVPRGMNPQTAVLMKDANDGVKWKIDLANGVARPEKPGPHMANYTVPVHPMLGCIAVAPGPAQAAPPTGDSGGWGGNMDFNEMVEGATLYLPVQAAGAFLYVGDGHAAQGDGETTGDALETSMDVEFTVDVIPGKSVPGPRVESATQIMAMGLAGTTDDALRSATQNMVKWLTDEYKLGPTEIGEVLGTAAEYKVSEIADRNAGVVLKINKERLKGLGGR
jgi:amidase